MMPAYKWPQAQALSLPLHAGQLVARRQAVVIAGDDNELDGRMRGAPTIE
jgi:hypothetical protein